MSEEYGKMAEEKDSWYATWLPIKLMFEFLFLALVIAAHFGPNNPSIAIIGIILLAFFNYRFYIWFMDWIRERNKKPNEEA